MEPKKLYWSKSDIEHLERTDPFGRAAIRRPGRDATVVAYGPSVPVALEAASAAADEGWDLEVIDLRTIVPFDDLTVSASVRRTGRCIVISEAAASRASARRSPPASRNAASTACKHRCSA